MTPFDKNFDLHRHPIEGIRGALVMASWVIGSIAWVVGSIILITLPPGLTA